MILIFKGNGWLVPATAVGAGLLCTILDLRDPRIVWTMVGFSGLVDHHFGTRWNGREGTWVQDPRTGEFNELRKVHSFFWIPMQYWLFIKLVAAALLLLTAITGRG